MAGNNLWYDGTIACPLQSPQGQGRWSTNQIFTKKEREDSDIRNIQNWNDGLENKKREKVAVIRGRQWKKLYQFSSTIKINRNVWPVGINQWNVHWNTCKQEWWLYEFLTKLPVEYCIEDLKIPHGLRTSKISIHR